MQSEKRGSKWGGRGANLCSAPKRRKMDNGYAETRNVAIKPANDESGEKRKPEDNEDKLGLSRAKLMLRLTS